MRKNGLVAEEVHRHLIDQVRSRAREQGFTVNALADAASISRSQLLRVFKGECSPTVETVTALAGALGCRPSDLLP